MAESTITKPCMASWINPNGTSTFNETRFNFFGYTSAENSHKTVILRTPFNFGMKNNGDLGTLNITKLLANIYSPDGHLIGGSWVDATALISGEPYKNRNQNILSITIDFGTSSVANFIANVPVVGDIKLSGSYSL